MVVPASSAELFKQAVASEIASLDPPALPLLGRRIVDDFDAGIDRWRSAAGVESITPRDEDSSSAGPWHRRPQFFATDIEAMDTADLWHAETFGPTSAMVSVSDDAAWWSTLERFHGSLTASLHDGDDELSRRQRWIHAAGGFAGRLILNGWPTGMRIGPATQHGGPFPASLDGRSTSVGFASIERFVRPVCLQG